MAVGEKICIVCGETKPFSDFFEHGRSQDGYSFQCKECAYTDTTPSLDVIPPMPQIEKSGLIEGADVFDSYFTTLNKQWDDPNFLPGIPTGYVEMDKYGIGFADGELTILAGRTGAGKSSIAMSMLLSAAKYLKRQNESVLYQKDRSYVAVFSLEMTVKQLWDRWLSQLLGVPALALRSLNIDRILDNFQVVEDETIVRRIQVDDIETNNRRKLYRLMREELISLPIIYNDDSATTTTQLEASISRELKVRKLGLVVVDYLQIMGDNVGGIRENISFISHQLRRIAKEYDVPILALAQLNRESIPDQRWLRTRTDKIIAAYRSIPQPQHMAESDAMVHAAHQILLIHRPAEFIPDPDEEHIKDAYINVAKLRSGERGLYALQFHKGQFIDWPTQQEREQARRRLRGLE